MAVIIFFSSFTLECWSLCMSRNSSMGKEVNLINQKQQPVIMPNFDTIEKRPRINIFKISGAYYFKHFFDDPELFRGTRTVL